MKLLGGNVVLTRAETIQWEKDRRSGSDLRVSAFNLAAKHADERRHPVSILGRTPGNAPIRLGEVPAPDDSRHDLKFLKGDRVSAPGLSTKAGTVEGVDWKNFSPGLGRKPSYHVRDDRGVLQNVPEETIKRVRGHLKATAPKRKANGGGAAEHVKLHWGLRGKGAIESEAPDPRVGPIVVLGELTVVEYRTRKGRDRDLTDYVHGFSGRKPHLAINGKGKLIIVGGTYRVEERGIVG